MNEWDAFPILVLLVVIVCAIGIHIEHRFPKCNDCGVRVTDKRHRHFLEESGLTPLCRTCFYRRLKVK